MCMSLGEYSLHAERLFSFLFNDFMTGVSDTVSERCYGVEKRAENGNENEPN